MKIFKIQRNTDKLFSLGGNRPKFSKKGKLWTALGHVVSHLNHVSDVAAADLTLIEYEINEDDGSMTVCTKTPISEIKADADVRREKRNLLLRVRRLKQDIEIQERRRIKLENDLAQINQTLGGKRG